MSRKRVVLDTNIVISALLFHGEVSRIHALWRKGAFIFLASAGIVREYAKVLAYPKFKLTRREIQALLNEEILPHIEPVTIPERGETVSRDPDDDKFLACAHAGRADCLVSGDADLLSLKTYKGCPIITAARFLKS